MEMLSGYVHKPAHEGQASPEPRYVYDPGSNSFVEAAVQEATREQAKPVVGRMGLGCV